MIQFRLFRIPIAIHWTFFLLTAFLGGAISAQQPDDWFRVLIFMLAAFHSILIHELGHALTGIHAAAAPMAGIQLHGMGGVAVFPNNAFTRGKSILVTAAGPAASILLAIVFIVILRFAGPAIDPYSRVGFFFLYFLRTMVFINLFWSVFNLVPVLPLDGGQILKDLLGPKHIKATCIIGFICLALMAIVLWLLTRSIYNMLVILALGSFTWRIWQQVRNS